MNNNNEISDDTEKRLKKCSRAYSLQAAAFRSVGNGGEIR